MQNDSPGGGSEQAKIWNGHAGRAWVDSQAVLDDLFRPFENLLVEAVVADGGRSMLDIGCGTGSTTLAVARRLGAESHCIGADISEPMIALARARAQQESSAAHFIVANAESDPFEAGRFDSIISRFGVMFFDDSIGAFSNLRRAAREGAGLHFIAWRSAAENPFMTTAERAAAPLLPNFPPRASSGPGQFAFADEQKVRGILEATDWSDVDIRPVDVTCTMPESELQHYFTRLGPVGHLLQETDEPARTRVIAAVRAAFEPYVHGPEVRFTAACWNVSALAQRGAASASPARNNRR